MASQAERAPLIASHSNIQRVQENAQNLAVHHFYTSHTLYILSLIITVCKILASSIVLSFREHDPAKPLKLWIAGVLLQDLFYFIFLLMKIPNIRRVQESLLLEESCSTLIFERMLTVAYVVWLIPGNLWYWKCGNCYDEAPILTTLDAIYIFAGYIYAVIPIFLFASLCLCLPVLIVVIMFITNASQNPANEDLLKSLKSEKYDGSVHKEQTTCAICACEFESRQTVIVLKCDARHFFHEECIKKWLIINANCPICRKEVNEQPE